jgi:hypothetical protein
MVLYAHPVMICITEPQYRISVSDSVLPSHATPQQVEMESLYHWITLRICSRLVFLKHFFSRVLSDSLVRALTRSALPVYGSLSSIYTTAPQLDNFIFAASPAIHPFGLMALLQFLAEHGIPSLFISIVLGLLLSVVFLCRRNQSSPDAPATLPHISLSYIMSSLKRRHDFFAWGFKVANQRPFQFRLLRVCRTYVALMALTFH